MQFLHRFCAFACCSLFADALACSWPTHMVYVNRIKRIIRISFVIDKKSSSSVTHSFVCLPPSHSILIFYLYYKPVNILPQLSGRRLIFCCQADNNIHVCFDPIIHPATQLNIILPNAELNLSKNGLSTSFLFPRLLFMNIKNSFVIDFPRIIVMIT